MIEIRDLTKVYGSQKAVNGLSFDIEPGRVTGFLGPNGAGKSTTMRMIVGLDRPTSGTVRVNGRRYGEILRPLHEVGAVLETGSVHSAAQWPVPAARERLEAEGDAWAGLQAAAGRLPRV